MKDKLKIKPEALVTFGLGLLTVAQFVLSSKKEAYDKKVLKEEIMKDLLSDK